MTYREFRRRVGEVMAAHDWLEGVSTIVGLIFLLLAGVCVVGVGVSIATLGDPDPGFKTSPGFLQAARGSGIVILGVMGFVFAGVGWFLAGDAMRRVLGRVRRRG